MGGGNCRGGEPGFRPAHEGCYRRYPACNAPPLLATLQPPAGLVGRGHYATTLLHHSLRVPYHKTPFPPPTRSDPLPDVRQSSFALVGDLASGCVAHLLPVLDPLVVACLAQLELPRISEDSLAACNNACWSLGEVLIKVDTERVAHSAGEQQPETRGSDYMPECLHQF